MRLVNDHSPVRSIVLPEAGEPTASFAMLAQRAHSRGASTAVETVHRGGLSPKQVRKAKEFMARHFGENILSVDVADACGLSRFHFVRAFRRTTGLPPRRWLRRYRVDRAKEMMLSSRLAVAEIAVRCGFADQSHLTRVFKALEGSSPGAWRRQHAAD